MMRKLVWTFAAAAILAAGGSLIHPFGNINSGRMKTPILSGSQIDPKTLGLMQRACQNCHSFNTALPFYGRIAPMSWLLERDVQQARLQMNFSRWQEYSPEDRIVLLSKIGSAVRNREMPLQRYLLLHSEARLSQQEREQIYQWTRAERKRLKSAQSPTGADRLRQEGAFSAPPAGERVCNRRAESGGSFQSLLDSSRLSYLPIGDCRPNQFGTRRR